MYARIACLLGLLGHTLFAWSQLPSTVDLARGVEDLRLYGASVGDELGAGGGIAIGDVNGDGTDDLVVAAAAADGVDGRRANSGEVYVYFGGAGLRGILDVGGEAGALPDVVIYGSAAGDWLGLNGAVALGDVNGDGVADLILGSASADGETGARPESGEAYIVYGGTGLSGTVDLAAGEADVRILGGLTRDGLTLPPGAVGDINGDGVDDFALVAVGADGPQDSRENAGALYVFFGAESLPPVIDLALGGADVVIHGARAQDSLPQGGIVLGHDVNGDTYPDIVLGTTLSDGVDGLRSNAGAAYVIYGSASFPAVIDLGAGEGDVTIHGASSGDQLTANGAIALGDVNNDGKADLLLGGFQADVPGGSRPDAGAAYIVYGALSLPSVVDLAEGTADVTVYGASTGDWLTSLGALSVADLNGDSYDDVIVATGLVASGPSDERLGAGKVYVIYGGPSVSPVVDLALEAQDVVIHGASSQDYLTLTRLAVADLNRDARDDLILVAPGSDGPEGGRLDAGAVYVVYGSASLASVVDLAEGDENVTVYGASSGDSLGGRGLLVADGDLNGDGVADLVLGASMADGPLESRDQGGEAYVLFGESADLNTLDATLLALELSGNLLPSSALVNQILDELSAIHALDPGTAQIHHAPSWEPGVLIVTLTPQAMSAFLAGTFTGFDALNAQFGPVDLIPLNDTVTLRFAQGYNPEFLAPLYAEVVGVVTVEPNFLDVRGENFVFENGAYTYSRPIEDGYRSYWGYRFVDGEPVPLSPADVAVDPALFILNECTPSGTFAILNLGDLPANWRVEGATGVIDVGPVIGTGEVAVTVTALDFSQDATILLNVVNIDNPSDTEFVTIEILRSADVTVEQALGQADPAVAFPIVFDVVFSDSVEGFAAGAVTMGGTAPGVSFRVVGEGTQYSIVVTGATGFGTIVPSLPARECGPGVLRVYGASTSTDNSVSYIDGIAPAVTVNQGAAQPDPTNALPIVFDVVFNEPVIGFDAADVIVGGTAPNPVIGVSGSGSSYTVTVTSLDGDGTVSPAIPAGVCMDLSGNPNNASTANDNVVEYDTIPPAVEVNQDVDQVDPAHVFPVVFQVEFDEPVRGFDMTDVTMGGTATGAQIEIGGSGALYWIEVVSVESDGTLEPTLGAGVCTDLAGNPNVASTSTDNSVTYERIPPPEVTVEQGVGQEDPTSTLPIVFDVVFSGAVTGFFEGGVVMEGTATGVVFGVSGSGTEYVITVTQVATNGTVVPTIAAGAGQDAYGNASNASTSEDNSVTYIDTTAPEVTVEQGAQQLDPTNRLPIEFEVTFSEAVTGFDAEDVVLTGTAGVETFTLTGAGTDYTILVNTVSGDGTVVADIPASICQDLNGNVNVVSTSEDNSVTYVAAAPDVTMNQGESQRDPTNSLPILFDVVFTQNVTGFTAGDLVVGGTATGVALEATGSGSTYTITVTSIATDGTVELSIPEGVSQDAAGKPNMASTSTDNTVNYDSTPPEVTVEQAESQADPAGRTPIEFEVVFTEPVSGFDRGDVVLSGSAGIESFAVSGGGAEYTVTVDVVTDGTIVVDVPAAICEDFAGNANLASTSRDNEVTYIRPPPDVQVEQGAGQPDPTNTLPIVFDVTFTFPVTGFEAIDVTMDGTAQVDAFEIEGIGANYRIVVTEISADGTVEPSIAAGVCQDVQGKPNTASTSVDNVVVYDSTPPTVVMTSTAPDPTYVAPIPVTATFSEPVTGFRAEAIVLGGATVIDFSTADEQAFTFELMPTMRGLITANIGPSAARDAAGNANLAAPTFSRMYGGPIPLPRRIDLGVDLDHLLVIYAAQTFDSMTFLTAVATGDLNGDGVDDLVLGAPDADGPFDERPEAGEAYIYFGSSALGGVKDVAGIVGDLPDVFIFGDDLGGHLTEGGLVDIADVNGDGIDDLLLGAPFADGPAGTRTNAGAAYVIYGSTEMPSTIDLAAGGADVTLYGAEANGIVSALTHGDVNGDGLDDIVIGASHGSGIGGDLEAGSLRVVFGSRSLPSTVDFAGGNADFTVYGASAGDLLADQGSVVVTDLNGDGVEDLVLGAPRADGPADGRLDMGEAYIVFGRPDLSGVVNLANGEQDVIIFGVESTPFEDAFSFPYFLADDLNGDGVADLVLAAWQADGPERSRVNAGEVYVLFGGEFEPVIDLAEGTQDLTIYGASAGDTLGTEGAMASGDLNGDGFRDLVLGSWYGSGPNNDRPFAGEARIVFGREVFPATIDLAQNEDDVVVYGASEDDRVTGKIVVDDFNADGLDDLILSARGADGLDDGRSFSGETYIIYGSNTLPAIIDLAVGSEDIVLYGPTAEDGVVAYTTGDLDGDGTQDVVLGAWRADGPGEARLDSGEAYALFGEPAQMRPPGVTVEQGVLQADPANALPIHFDVVFSKSVTGFDAEDVTMEGTAQGVVFEVSGSAARYRISVTGVTGEGTVVASIPEGVCEDAFGIPNLASTSLDNSVTYASAGPALAIGRPSVSITNSGPVEFPVTYAWADTVLLAVENIVLDATGTATGIVTVSGTGNELRTVTISSIEGDGSLGISITAGTASDTAGRMASAVGPSATFVVDNTAPSVSLASNTPDPTDDLSIPVTVIFSEPVAGFTASDIVATNGVIENFHGFGALYTCDLIPLGPGLVSADIAGGVAEDGAGNGNLDAPTFVRTISGPVTAPTVDFSESVYRIERGETAATITVNLSAPAGTGNSVQVGFRTLDDTALADIDYVPVEGVLTFDATETTKSFSVGLLNGGAAPVDAVSLVLELEHAVGATLGTLNNPARLEILPEVNDPPTIEITFPHTENLVRDNAATLSWAAGDPDDNALIAIGFDTDDRGFDGVLIRSGIDEDRNPTGTIEWDLSEVPNGVYWVYGLVDDGVNPVAGDYGGTITVSHPEPVADKTLIFYIDYNDNGEFDEDEGTPDTIVYHNGGLIGNTDANGAIQIDGLLVGDVLFGKKKVAVQEAFKAGHEAVGGTLYDIWVDSDSMRTPNGSNAPYGNYRHATADDSNPQYVELGHPVFAWNLTVAVEYVPNAATRAWWEEGFERVSTFLYDLMDGQMRLGKVHIDYGAATDSAAWRNADVTIRDGEQWPSAYLNGAFSPTLGVKLGRLWKGREVSTFTRNSYYRAIAHEFGHHALGLFDEYVNGNSDEVGWRRHRRNNPRTTPQNYGVMDNNWTSSELSSANDYLTEYPNGPNTDPATVTNQIWNRALKNTGQAKSAWGAIEEDYSAILAAISPSLALVLPPIGVFHNGVAGSEDRSGPKPHQLFAPFFWDTEITTAGASSAKDSGEAGGVLVVPVEANTPLKATIVRVTPTGTLRVLGTASEEGVLEGLSLSPGDGLRVYLGTRLYQAAVHEPVGRVELTASNGRAKQPAEEQGVVVQLDLEDAAGAFTVLGFVSFEFEVLEAPEYRVTSPDGAAWSGSLAQGANGIYTFVADIGGALSGVLEIQALTTAGSLATVGQFEVNPSAGVDGLADGRITLGALSEFPADAATLIYTSSSPTFLHQAPRTGLAGPVTAIAINEVFDAGVEGVIVTLRYTDEEVRGLDETSLVLTRWSALDQTWIDVLDQTLEPGLNMLQAVVYDETSYALFGVPSDDQTPPGAVSDPAAEPGESPWSVVLSWIASGDDSVSGAAASYDLRFSTEPINEGNWDDALPYALDMLPAPAGSLEEVSLIMPDPGVLYYFALAVYDEAGNVSSLSSVDGARSYAVDSDGDLLPDGYEESYGLDPARPDGGADLDGDGLDNLTEYLAQTDPLRADSDFDGLDDGWELEHGLNPLSSVDDDGPDADPDGDGFSNLEEAQAGTDPLSFESQPTTDVPPGGEGEGNIEGMGEGEAGLGAGCAGAAPGSGGGASVGLALALAMLLLSLPLPSRSKGIPAPEKLNRSTYSPRNLH